MVFEDKVTRDNFLRSIRGEGIDARQIDDRIVFRAADFALLAFNGDAGEIADVLIGTGQLVEQRGFATVLISRKCKYHELTSSGSTSIFFASSRRMVS